VRRLLVAAIVLTGSLVGFASPAHACTCASVDGPADDEAYAAADAVFVGVPVEHAGDHWVVRVDRVYKGEVTREQRVPADVHSTCSVELVLGVRALVFLQDGGANRCNGTRESALRPVPATWRAHAPLDPPSDGRPWWPFAAAGAAALGAAALVARARIVACRPSALPRSLPS
jgi:hypothetical protein